MRFISSESLIFLSRYETKKKIANRCKRFLWKPETLSTVPPLFYRNRWVAYLDKVILTDPNKIISGPSSAVVPGNSGYDSSSSSSSDSAGNDETKAVAVVNIFCEPQGDDVAAVIHLPPSEEDEKVQLLPADAPAENVSTASKPEEIEHEGGFRMVMVQEDPDERSRGLEAIPRP